MDELLSEIADFQTRHGLSDREFGRLALGDHHFLRDLKADPPRSPSLKTVDRVRGFMRDYVPAQAAA